MKKLIIANWKSNKTSIEAEEWIKQLTIDNLQLTNKEIVVCPPFTLLPILKEKANELGIKLGAQNISPFGEGAFTGEVNGEQIKELADFVIVGHSERRKNFGEKDEVINRKIEQAIANSIVPILCISSLDQLINHKSYIINQKAIVAYEPLEAIGTGNPDTPENAEQVAKKIREINNEAMYILYGGSVSSGNVNDFTKMPNINGVLVGNASLDPKEFLELIKNA